MPLKRSKKTSKKTSKTKALKDRTNEVESEYTKIRRLRLEKEAQEEAQRQLDIENEKKEKERQQKVITKYLDKLEAQVKEKEIKNFWVFMDAPGFKKISTLNKEDMQIFIFKNPEKFVNRQLAHIRMEFYQNDNSLKQNGTFLFVAMAVYNIDKQGTLEGDHEAEICRIIWKANDFKLTKFSLKLIEAMIRPVAAGKVDVISYYGQTITSVIKKFKDHGVNLYKYCEPLAKA